MTNSPRSAGRSGSGPDTFSSHHLMRSGFPSVCHGLPGCSQRSRISVTYQVRPRLEMLDARGFHVAAELPVVEADPGEDTAARFAHLFDNDSAEGTQATGSPCGHAAHVAGGQRLGRCG
jgi:hypothetical protein